MKVLVVGDSPEDDGSVSATGRSPTIDRQLDAVAGEGDLSIERSDGLDGVEPRSLEATDLVVALGESVLLDLVRQRGAVPVLPVGMDNGVESVGRQNLESALEAVAGKRYDSRAVRTLEVDSDGDHFRALMDVMAVTADPARISEFRVSRLGGERATVVDTVRADGLLASAPAGTPGYGTAAGGPILDPALEAVGVVPIGPFRVEQSHWVLELPISIAVARGEVPVSLLVDDHEVGTVEPGAEIELTWGDPIEIVRTPVSASPLGGSGERTGGA